MSRIHFWAGLPLIGFACGCALTEVRSKHSAGVEYRHSGKSATNEDRYSVQQGLEFKWDGGVSTGLTYRRRDVDDGGGDNDNGMWFDISFPIWKAKDNKQADLERRIERLERELAQFKEASTDERVALSNQ